MSTDSQLRDDLNNPINLVQSIGLFKIKNIQASRLVSGWGLPFNTDDEEDYGAIIAPFPGLFLGFSYSLIGDEGDGSLSLTAQASDPAQESRIVSEAVVLPYSALMEGVLENTAIFVTPVPFGKNSELFPVLASSGDLDPLTATLSVSMLIHWLMPQKTF